jgi:hypothetical protein
MKSTPGQGLLAFILARKLKFNLWDGWLVQGGFVLGGSRHPKPPTWASIKMEKVESPLGKSRRFWNLGSSLVSEWPIATISCLISKMVSIMRSSILEVKVSSSPYGWVHIW